MDLIAPIVLIVAGILAASGFIISRKPDARQLIDKIVPFQGYIGVLLLLWGIVDTIRLLTNLDKIGTIGSTYPFYSISMYAGVASEVLLGFLLGMPLIATWIPGESAAEQRAMEMQKKVVPFQTIIGFIGIVAAVLLLYYYFKFH